MTNTTILRSILILWAIGLTPPTALANGAAQAYVTALQGKWKGGGIVTTDKKNKKVKLRCSTTNTLNFESRTLTMKGRCASSIGSKPMVGQIQYSADGESFDSVSLTIAGRGGEGEVSLQGNTLTLSHTEESETGEIKHSRNLITEKQGQYSIDLQSEIEGEYVSRGVLTFKPRKPKKKA
ncbi:MAG: hypothetical protein AAF431_18315 [Pseudomonadota bacterium]